jgi:glycosyltransferase involved in cell wall biosynthesis
MKTIAVITPKIDTFSNPTLVLLFERLIGRGYRILFFGFDQLFIPKEYRDHIEVHDLPFNFYSFFGRPKSYRRPADVVKLLKQYYGLRKLFKVHNKVEALICIDPMGLVYGGRIRRLINVKIIYASFEIFFEKEFYDEEKKMIKKLETKHSPVADVVMVQDKVREGLLRSENRFRSDAIFIHVPVSPKLAEIRNGYDIHKELNIPADKMIVVYSGNLQRWSGISEMLDLFPEKWKNDMWLVIHSHYILPAEDPLKERIEELTESGMNITFHNKPFYNNTEYYSFLAACQIGIALYFPNTIDFFAGLNIIEIGLSSGKFSTYMMLGLPAITTSNTIFRELNEEFSFGVTVKKADEIPEGLSLIRKEYEKKVSGSRKLFEKILDPDSKLEELLTQIEKYYK